jgi:hypothetical protein
MAYSLADAKANISELYGNAARLVADREAQIQASYNDVANQVRDNAKARATRAAGETQAEGAGMTSAAQSRGLQVPAGAGARTASFRGVDADENESNRDGWVDWLVANRDINAGRNLAQSHAFGYLGSKALEELDRQYLSSLSGGGYGGGGGRGGGGSSSDGTTYPSRVAQLQPNVARGLAATSIRLTDQGNAFKKAGISGAIPKNYTYSVKANSNPALRQKEDLSNRR